MALVLAGKPNVGKSSVFNRLVGRRRALVVDRPGVTLDRIVEKWNSGDREIEVWDLAGIQLGESNVARDWVQRISAILFVVDGSEPLTSEDRAAFDMVKKWGKPILVLINKADKRTFEENQWNALELPADAHFVISAELKDGLLDLEEYCFKSFAEKTSELSEHRVLIFGRPNVGKSSLLNRLAGTHISKVSDIPGTTRDLVEAEIQNKDRSWMFVDTAGVRKKSRVYSKEDVVEIFSVTKAINELRKADFCLFLVEANAAGIISTQDKKLLKLLSQAQKPAIVLVNKWDQIRGERRRVDTYVRSIQRELREMGHLPVILISAKSGFGMKSIFKELHELVERQKKISTPSLNRWLKSLMETRTPRIARAGSREGKKKTQTQYLNFLYMTQTSHIPMRFQIFCNAPAQVAPEEKRFIENQLRESFGLQGLPITLRFRKKT